ncbi:hypothetical protein ACFWGD_09380 [Corynebacterium sp. NPDC060344]|uniref:hypothetical protein n=1 Tax=Corynebacterium sp. NPDC060344 TaxID=3347101 RepID=UPI00364C6262
MSLAGYSPVASMQMVATQHSAAITGSSGCSTQVASAMDAEITWSAANLKSMITALASHEADTGAAFTAIDPHNTPNKLQVADGLLHHAFGARPPFNPGTLTFAPAAIGPELADTADQLLAKFTATNDAAIGDAITYWTGYATRMTELATTLGDAAGKLLSDNNGAAFDAAATSLTGLAARATNIAASAGILTGHLAALPAIKAMAINTLGTITAHSQAITDPAAKQAFERTEITAFLTGPYIGQLHTAVPTLPNLTQPDFRTSAPDLVASGVSGGHGIAGASQAGLAPAGMTTAAAAPASAASSMAQAASGPITGPTGMSPTTGTPATSPVAPSTSGPVPTVPGGATPAPMSPAAATTPASTPAGTLGTGPAGMAPAAGTGGAGYGAGGAGTNAGRGGSALGSLGGFNPGAGGRSGGFGTGAGPGAGSAGGRGVGRGGFGGPGIHGPGTGSGANSGTTSGTGSARGSQSAAAIVGRQGAAGGGGAGAASSRTTGGVYGAAHRNQPGHGANVGSIHGTGRDFEQDEYQRELFGEEPTTVPAVIGANVRG